MISLEEVTIAEPRAAAATRLSSRANGISATASFRPTHRDSDLACSLGNGGMFYYPQSARPHPIHKTDPHTTDRIADEAVSFIDQHRQQPFFVYVPFLDVHTPLEAPADLVAKYERKKLSAPPDSWGQERERKVRRVQNHAVYAAMVEQMDRAVGRVLSAIDRTGLAERTIVVFTSDNGGLSTSEGHPTSNLPLRGGKGWPYEGGIRVPLLIIGAPGVTRPGSCAKRLSSRTDFYPTILELTRLAPAPGATA